MYRITTDQPKFIAYFGSVERFNRIRLFRQKAFQYTKKWQRKENNLEQNVTNKRRGHEFRWWRYERDKIVTRQTSSKSFTKTKITNNEHRLRVQCRFCSFVSHTQKPQSWSENDLSPMKRHILYSVSCNYDK